MPREHRKRGKKHKLPKEEPAPVEEEHFEEPEQADDEAGPSRAPDAPFGLVDPDVKAYFRTVDEQLKEWQDDRGDADDGAELNEDRRNFIVAALSEMAGKELALATDPDCAAIVERMLHSMDDFLKRVFVDRLSGSFDQLMAHRFGSHVCQTIFSLAGATVARECRGELPDHPDAAQLRTLARLVTDACEEIMQHCGSFVSHPFASHVLRAILVLLCPSIAPEDSEKSNRSKKSASFRAKQGPMKSIFNQQHGPRPAEAAKDNSIRPKEFRKTARSILESIKSGLGENEIRALAADKAGSPTLQLVVELEAHLAASDTAGSIMDQLLVGIISSTHNDPHEPVTASDYLTTILHDATSSRLLETLVSCSPPAAFRKLWSTYFVQSGRLQKLAVHPVANFVVAKCAVRLDADEFKEAMGELEGTWIKMRKTARFGVLKAFIDRAISIPEHAAAIALATATAFELTSEEDHKLSVSCILRQKSAAEYRSIVEAVNAPKDNSDETVPRRGRQPDRAGDALEPKIQGALLLQSLLHLPEPHHALVVDSLLAQTPDELLALAHHPVSSRVLDEVFAPTMVSRVRKALAGKFIGHFHTLADDRIGSRVAERAWSSVDTYFKEKVARSLLPYENFLTGSHYGRYFGRAVNLSLLQRKPDEWRAMQTARAREAQAAAAPPIAPTANSADADTRMDDAVKPDGKRNKRKREGPADEIDEVFATVASGGKKKHKTSLESTTAEVPTPMAPPAPTQPDAEKKKRKRDKVKDEDPTDVGEVSLDASILQAIRTAPHGDVGGHGRSRKDKDKAKRKRD